MDYFYARVSSERQNEARQLDAAADCGIDEKNVYIDKESGKDFNRTNWKRLFRKLKKGDVLYVKSLDRIGRNYKEILRVWQEITKDKEVDVVVLDMAILDTRREKNLLGTFIADLVLQVLSFVAENERENIKQRQREGIAAAKARGVVFGRKVVPPPAGFEDLAKKYLNGEVCGWRAASILGMSTASFRRKALQLGKKTKCFSVLREKLLLPRGYQNDDVFDAVAEKWFDGEISAKEAGARLGIHWETFQKYAHIRHPGRTSAYRKKGTKYTKWIDDERFRRFALLWFKGGISAPNAAVYFNMSETMFAYIAKLTFPGLKRVTRGYHLKPNPPNFEFLVADYKAKKIKLREAVSLSGLSEPIFLRRVKEFRK